VWKVSDLGATPLTIRTDASGLVAFDAVGEFLTTATAQPMGGSASVDRWDAATGSPVRTRSFDLSQPWNHCVPSPDGGRWRSTIRTDGLLSSTHWRTRPHRPGR